MPTRSRKASTLASSDVASKKQIAAPSTTRAGKSSSIVAPKLNAMQLAELLSPFWAELLQNNMKSVQKFIREKRANIDFNTARYTPCADGTGLHLCAQHGFSACAKTLLDVGVKINLQNKVGSTALHVACKFNQTEMVTFLLEIGARMDIPDMRNNAPFDVAPYSLVDSCMLAPQREKLAAEQKENDLLLALHEASICRFEETTIAKAHASMLLIDWESRSWEEWHALQAANKLDRQWSEQVQSFKDQLEAKKKLYVEQQHLLQQEQNEILQMWQNILLEAQNRQEEAREELEQMFMLTDETGQLWLQEQQELMDQCGLIETAQQFPNDTEVQFWVLSTIIALIDEAGCVSINLDQKLVGTGIHELLLRGEIFSVIHHVLLRFPTLRDLQFSAIQCFVRLARYCMNGSQLDTINFLTVMAQSNVMALSRDVFFRFSNDIKLAHLVIELLYHLLRFRGTNEATSFHFCRDQLNHQIPLQILRLHEAVHYVQEDAEPTGACGIDVNAEATSTARHHISFLLFTLVTNNARNSLTRNGVLPLIRRLIFTLTTSFDTKDELKTSTLRYLLGTLALLQSQASSQQDNDKTSHQSDSPTLWTVDELRELLDAIQPWLAVSLISNVHRNLAFWTIKLLDNLSNAIGDGVVQLRTWLRTRKTFDFFANITFTIREYELQEDDDSAVQNVAIVWLHLVENIWLCRHNSDGQLAATCPFILDFLLRQFELEAQITGQREDCNVFTTISALLKLFALILTNAKNMRYLEYKIDATTQNILQKVMKVYQKAPEYHNGDQAVELLTLILRVYLRFIDYKQDQFKAGRNLHERCRAIGICAALQAFKLSTESESVRSTRNSSPISNANQNVYKCPNSKFKSKMNRACQWSDQQLISPELRTVTHTLLLHAPCSCYCDNSN